MINPDFDELDKLIQNTIENTKTLPDAFKSRTAEKMLALHSRRQNRRLYVDGILYFCIAMAFIAGLATLINTNMTGILLTTLIIYKFVFAFGFIMITCALLLEKWQTDKPNFFIRE